MKEHEMNQGYEMDGNLLDLGSSQEGEFDPFGDTSFADEPTLEQETQENKKTASVEEDNEPITPPVQQKNSNPLEMAMDAVETKAAEETKKSLVTKSPVFCYAAATEEVEDTSITFEDLRIVKATDFPELDDGKRVSWTVEYGKITKSVSNPKGTTIAKFKSDIETSKEFLDSLKKSKDKEPVCKLKPKVTAQSKGFASAYKSVCTSMDEAIASGKLITLIPARDGKVYQMRNNELGKFITPSVGSDLLSDIQAGFYPALPPIPGDYLLDIIAFFRVMAEKGSFEALVNIYWDKQENDYVVDVPEQTVTPVSVKSAPNPDYDNDRYINFMDIHSHNTMNAYFSSTDNRDEKATRVYAVIGKIFDLFPQIKVRISNGETFMEIDPCVVFGDCDGYVPDEWSNKITFNWNALNKKSIPLMLPDLANALGGGEL